jgi:hypothetical protein
LICCIICDLIKINEKDKCIHERKLVCCDADREVVPFVSSATLIEKELLLDWGEFTKLKYVILFLQFSAMDMNDTIIFKQFFSICL